MPGRGTYCWVGRGRLAEMKIEISEEGTVGWFHMQQMQGTGGEESIMGTWST